MIHNFSELNSIANNAKIQSLLKFLLIPYMAIKGTFPQKEENTVESSINNGRDQCIWILSSPLPRNCHPHKVETQELS